MPSFSFLLIFINREVTNILINFGGILGLNGPHYVTGGARFPKCLIVAKQLIFQYVWDLKVPLNDNFHESI